MLDKKYNHLEVEKDKYEFWLKNDYFKAGTDKSKKPFCIVIPPPNVTGKLHLGHAWDTTLQDIIIRYKRMDGYDALWLPGMDHAGIATQAKVDKKLKDMGIKPREMDRDEWLKVAWDWKKEYAENIHAVMENKNDYVVIAPVNMLYKGNYEELLKQHVESGAEVSVLYQHVDNAKENYIGCDVLQMNKQRGVLSIAQNLCNYKSRYLSLQTYIMSKEIFKTLVEEAQETSSMYWFKDILNDKCVDMDIRGLNYRGHIYVINDLKSYYESNMQFLTEEKMKDIADPEWPVYTRTSDSAPAIYLNGGTATGSLISNGCEISGVVKNSIVGRSCKIGKDALIENCIIMPDVEIADGAHLKNVIVDKHSRIAKKKELAGLEEQPLYIGRRENV